MPISLYEHLMTRGLADLARSVDPGAVERSALEEVDAPLWLARHAANELFRSLRAVRGEDAIQRQIALTNRVLQIVRETVPDSPPGQNDVQLPGELLFSLHEGTPPARTELPFAVSTLLTRAKGEPSIGHELSREIATAERIDALVSFVTLSGFRCLQGALERHAAAGRSLRLLTTTYIGATEADAVDAIALLPGVEVRISYDVRHTRLHAKAWLFGRPNSLDTAYVGSANLSKAGLFSGHEWMVKVANADLPHVVEKFRGAFETLWQDREFEPYDPNSHADRKRLRAALENERGGGSRESRTRVFFNLRPYPFQQEILEHLDAERTLHGRKRNLVVAATGTGKTVVAAFDYQRQVGPSGLRPRLLFLAHREELLVQARDVFRHVVRDESFGELLVGTTDPADHDHLFATVQSFNSRGLLERYGAQHWDYVVVDECHHVPAPTYQAFIERIQPQLLLGLTATPERTDGKSLLPDFDGHIAAELRLWHALERQLLAPFEYYGIYDGVDLRQAWRRGTYVAGALEELYTGNDRRAELVVAQLNRLVGAEGLPRMRALAFCSSVAHAEFMARKFTDLGVPAMAVHGGSPVEKRTNAPEALRSRQINILVTCDLYNEGVDLPFVDTLLFLRPTESATLFLQQLGRGLRLHPPDKQSCLVLDFIGHHHDDFRFDRLISAMTGLPRGGLREAVENGFPTLPSGCHLDLDRVSREIVLNNIKRRLRGGITRVAQELRDIATSRGPAVTLEQFLEDSGRDLDELYDAGGWTIARRAAGLLPAEAPAGESDVAEKFRLLLHIDDPDRLVLYARAVREPERILAGEYPRAEQMELDRRRLLMLGYRLFRDAKDRFGPEEIMRRLAPYPELCGELDHLFSLLLDRVSLTGSRTSPDPAWPLALHRRYDRREILTAIGRWNEARKPDSREGLVRVPDAHVELFFVTLDKTSKRFSPTTRYEDYAISERLFHWQSQSGTSAESESGQRYIQQSRNGWGFRLFVRPTPKDVFTYLGRVRYLRHEGSRPMSIVWELDSPIPGSLLTHYVSLAA